MYKRPPNQGIIGNYSINPKFISKISKLAGSNSNILWDNNLSTTDFPGNYGAVSVDKTYNWSRNSGWSIDKNEKTNFVVWLTNDTNNAAKTLIYSNQTINYDTGSKVWFNKTDYDYVNDLNIVENLVLSEDMTIDEDYIFLGNIDLNGHTMTVNGDFTQVGGTLKINGGRLEVLGNYTIGAGNNYAYADLIMNNTDDYVYINGNFIINTIFGKDAAFTAGTMEIKGDFTQKAFDTKAQNDFNASGTHKVILNGSEVQNITFETPEYSRFNELVITKPLSKGYNNSSFEYNILTEDFDKELPSTPSNLSAEGKDNGDVVLTWTESFDNIKVVNYNIYRNNEKIAETTECQYVDSGLSSSEYIYYVTASEFCNESEPSNNALYTLGDFYNFQ